MSHLILPSGADWMTMEERADNHMNYRVKSILPLLDEHVLDSEFFLALDSFYDDAKSLSIRGRRDDFERVVLLVCEALILEKYKFSAYSKYLNWRFELHRKRKVVINESEVPKEMKNFLIQKKNVRVEGVVDLYFKSQKKEWFNPYLSFVGVRPENIYEVKILFKNLSEDLKTKTVVQLKDAEFQNFFNHLVLTKKQYLEFQIAGVSYYFSAKARKTLIGESVELGLFV